MTGYTRDDADELAFDVNDDRLGPIRLATASHHVIAVTGAPIRMNGALCIGSFILFPDHSQSLYIKQFLHPGEELHFSPSFDHNPLIRSGEERISLAICADIDHPDHGCQARDRQSWSAPWKPTGRACCSSRRFRAIGPAKQYRSESAPRGLGRRHARARTVQCTQLGSTRKSGSGWPPARRSRRAAGMPKPYRCTRPSTRIASARIGFR